MLRIQIMKNEKKTHSSGIFHLKNSFIAVFFFYFYANPISGKIEFSFIFVHKIFALIKKGFTGQLQKSVQ